MNDQDRIESLLQQLTLEEKCQLCSGADAWHTQAIERLGIPALRMTDGPHGVRTTVGDWPHNERTLPATCFPTATAMAATWNTDLVQRVGEALADETKAKGNQILLGPAVNIHRSPLCGRNFEYFSEDPYLAGRMAVAYIQGLQSQGVGASLKHFACNSSEFERMTINAQVDARALREIYLPAFEAAVKEAAPWTVMCSYNRINGPSASANSWLLTDVLKDEWGFDGFLVSDWGAVYERVPAANAGTDLEMPGKGPAPTEELLAAVKDGHVSERVIDDKVRRILRIVARAGLFDGPPSATPETTDTPERRALAREAACEGITLLKNDNGLLPLDEKKSKTLAVFGPIAELPIIEGGGSSRVNPYYAVSALQGLQARCGAAIKIEYEAGCDMAAAATEEALTRAENLAGRADVAVVVVGLPDQYETEGHDRPDLELSGGQVALIERVAAANPRTVVVTVNGAPINLSGWAGKVDAIVEAWYGGQEAGNAIAAVLLGDVTPSGKLAMTFPKRIEDTPAYLNWPGENGQSLYGESIFVGYRYYDAKLVEPLFPFGHGLSYTTFAYANARVSQSQMGPEDVLRVSVDVTNTGTRAGKEVVQLYVRDVKSSLVRPPQELKGFQKVSLNPGETQAVTFALTRKALAFYDPKKSSFVAEAGEFEVLLGSSSRDVRARAAFTFVVPGGKSSGPDGRVFPRLDADTPLAEILADAEGKAVLARHMGALLDSPFLKWVVRSTLNQLAYFQPDFIKHDWVAVVDAELKQIK